MNLKSSFLIISMLVAPLCIIMAQGPAIALQTVCWTTPSAVDSNITAYWLISSRDSVPRLINYLDAQGQTVNVSAGGTYQNGYCCCTGGGSGDTYRTVASQMDSLLGLTTFTVGFIDTVGLDIASLVQSAPKGDGYLVFYDELTNRNYKILLSSLMPEPYPGYTSCECDTIYQVAHGFALGDVVGQVRGNGLFFTATTGNADSLPVAYVHEVLHADTFVIKSEGWLMDWTHGLPLGRDYFIQDDGSRDTIPDSTYSAFAFRTINTTKAYFDIPELVVDQSPGGGGTGGGTFVVTASNGLNDQDGGTDVDVELGGALDKNTDVTNASFLFRLGKVAGAVTNYFYNNGLSNVTGMFSSNSATGEESQVQFSASEIQIQGSRNVGNNLILLRIQDEVAQLYSAVSSIARGVIYIDTTTIEIRFNNTSGNRQSDVKWDNTSVKMSTYNAAGSVVQTQIELTDDYIKLTGTPDYANDAAADADGSLPSGAIYTVTAEDRTIRIKP